MAIYNQEHGDYGAYRKYPFTDASTLKTASGVSISSSLLTDAVVYVSAAGASDATAWLDLVDLGNRSVRVKTVTGRTLSGTIAGTQADLRDDVTLLPAGVLLFNGSVLSAAGRVRYEFSASGAVFNASCVFALTVPGVASVNRLSGHVTLEGRDGVQVFTGEVDGRPVLRVDAIGRPVTRDNCPDVSKTIRCVRFIQEAGAPLAVGTTGRGDAIITGVSSFTGEALCTRPRAPSAVNVLAGAVTGGAYSPEQWLANQSVRDTMREAGYFWAVAPLTAPPAGGSQTADGLVLTWVTGGPLLLSGGRVPFRGDYSGYGYTVNPSNWHVAPAVSIRNFTITAGRASYTPVRPVVWNGSWQVLNTTYTVTPFNNNPEFADTYYVSVPDASSFDEVLEVYPDSTLVRINPDDTTYLPFAALLPIREVAAWVPAEAQEVLVCAKYGAVNIYGPHYEAGSNPIKSDRDNGSISLRGGSA